MGSFAGRLVCFVVAAVVICAATCVGSNGNPISGEVTSDPWSAMFTPSSAFAHDMVYTATLTTGIRAQYGSQLSMSIPYAWSFTTKAGEVQPDMQIISVSPTAGQAEVSRNTFVIAVFDREIDPSSVDSTTLVLKDPDGYTVSGSVDCEGPVVRFVPSDWLGSYSTYTATISGNVRDMQGETLGADYSWSFTTGSLVNYPMVVATVPVNSATGVSRRIAVKAYFDQPINTWSVYSSSFYLEDPNYNQVYGEVTSDGLSATITPEAPLAPETTYTATVSSSVYSVEGYSLQSPHSWSFTTGVSTPLVTYTWPGNGQTNTNTEEGIYVSFDQDIDPSSIDTSTFLLEDADHNPISGSVWAMGSTDEFHPSQPMQPYATYTATLTTGVRGANGLTMEEPYSWSFTTGSGKPTVSYTTPSDGYANWWGAKPITVGFSMRMDNSTITADTFKVEDSDHNPVSGGLSVGDYSTTFTPASPFLANTTYTVTITAGVKSASGFAMEEDYVWTFTTATNLSNRIGDVKKLPDYTLVALSGKGLYYTSSDGITYVEESDRSAGIRYDGAYLQEYPERVIDIAGMLRTNEDGERIIEAAWTWISSDSTTVIPVGATNKTVKMGIMEGVRVKVWGVVKLVIDENTVVISDGSYTEGLTIKSANAITAGINDMIAVTGAAGYENARVIRAQQIDVLVDAE